jgi:hypothetical protein
VEWLIPMLLVALVTLTGIALLIAGWLRKSLKMRRVGIGLTAAPWVLWIVLFIAQPGIDEWNPKIESDVEVWGTWEGEGRTIELRPDGGFAFSAQNESMGGRWKRNDWNLHLTGDWGTRRMRFVEDAGELRLLPKPPSGGSHETGPVMKKK